MRVSVSVSNFSWTGPESLANELRAVARAADDARVDTVWLPDHLLQVDPRSKRDDEMLEAYTTLGFIAGQTQHIRLGALVTPVTYRYPTLLVKAVSSLDVLSEGRSWFGIGAGYSEDESQAMDLRLPPTAERFDRLEEMLLLALRMWSGDASPFDGTYYRPREPLNNPPTPQRPHPPILIGGQGERRTLRLVARYADACNLSDFPDEGKTVRHKLSVLARHCEEVGRPYEEIERTVSTGYLADEPPEHFVERCELLAQWGLQHVVLFPSGPWTGKALESLATAVPMVDQITV
jgi:F420-dependent oxidoreductase-like protein